MQRPVPGVPPSCPTSPPTSPAHRTLDATQLLTQASSPTKPTQLPEQAPKPQTLPFPPPFSPAADLPPPVAEPSDQPSHELDVSSTKRQQHQMNSLSCSPPLLRHSPSQLRRVPPFSLTIADQLLQVDPVARSCLSPSHENPLLVPCSCAPCPAAVGPPPSELLPPPFPSSLLLFAPIPF